MADYPQMKKNLVKQYPSKNQSVGTSKDKRIRFDIREEQEVRAHHKKISQEIVKLRQAGYPIKSSYAVPPDVARNYKLKPSENFQIIEFNRLSTEDLEDLKTFIVSKMKIEIFKVENYTYKETGTECTRLIVDLKRVK